MREKINDKKNVKKKFRRQETITGIPVAALL
jgi:hypothetical protein